MVAETIYAFAALGSVVAAILAWVAKIRWSNDYRQAKEAEIAAYKAQIDGLERFLPSEVWIQYENLAKFYEGVSKELAETRSELLKTKADLIETENKYVSTDERLSLITTAAQRQITVVNRVLAKLDKRQIQINSLRSASLSPSQSASASVSPSTSPSASPSASVSPSS